MIRAIKTFCKIIYLMIHHAPKIVKLTGKSIYSNGVVLCIRYCFKNQIQSNFGTPF